ncbi:hypothetical protein, partial [Belliella pelovolcani]|uniref:hypothetical protein n=1 Tax=Belliella pelovolcani TaxID=529505 RepID=UPI003918F417
KAKKEGVYPIKETDWTRLKRLVKGIIPNKSLFQILSSISFGVFASAIFALIGFNTAEKLDNWVIPTTWVIFSVSLIAGIGLLILDRLQKDMITYSTNDVLTEMTEIEKSFDKPDEGQE